MHGYGQPTSRPDSSARRVAISVTAAPTYAARHSAISSSRSRRYCSQSISPMCSASRRSSARSWRRWWRSATDTPPIVRSSPPIVVAREAGLGTTAGGSGRGRRTSACHAVPPSAQDATDGQAQGVEPGDDDQRACRVPGHGCRRVRPLRPAGAPARRRRCRRRGSCSAAARRARRARRVRRARARRPE